jgi:very-short-patch-repair endonuclease
LPLPVVNAIVAGHEVDFHWPAYRLVVETDGGGTHTTAIAFERDRRRDLHLELAGWHVIRLSWRQVLEQPESVIALLDSHFRRSPAQPAVRERRPAS